MSPRATSTGNYSASARRSRHRRGRKTAGPLRSVENISTKGPLNCGSLGCPGFPVKLGGVGELHAPFLTERRTRDRVRRSVAGNPGTLGMTKGRANASLESGCWGEGVSSPWVGRRLMTPPSKNISRKGPLNCRSLGCPGFPVKLGGVGELHAPFLTERRTRDSVRRGVAGNPGTLGMTKGRANASLESGCWGEGVSSPWVGRRLMTPLSKTFPRKVR